MSCVEVCPVDCIVEFKGEDAGSWKNQLYIDPEECINCGVCEPECPWEAIFPEDEVPEAFSEDTELNYKMEDFEDDFEVQEEEEYEQPSPEQVAANKAKWGASD